MTRDLKTVLNDRGNQYGSFSGFAVKTQELKAAVIPQMAEKLQEYIHNGIATPVQRDACLEGMEMILCKIGRIVNGNPTHDDSWKDIAGYARIVERVLTGEEEVEKE